MKLSFRVADEGDLPAILALLKDDILGQTRETASEDGYLNAFKAMLSEANNDTIVGEHDNQVLATYQISITSGLSLGGAKRSTLESIRVSTHVRGEGLGAQLIADAVARSMVAGCTLVQLNTNTVRKDAQRFYEAHGFIPSHVGYKLPL